MPKKHIYIYMYIYIYMHEPIYTQNILHTYAAYTDISVYMYMCVRDTHLDACLYVCMYVSETYTIGVFNVLSQIYTNK